MTQQAGAQHWRLHCLGDMEDGEAERNAEAPCERPRANAGEERLVHVPWPALDATFML